MNDVTAVILTIGERSTQRAIESVKSQTLQPCDIIVIGHVAPFHKAMNHTMEKVKSDFFVQVDADMILDDNCFAELRRCMEPQVGLVVGHLRDPLVRRVVGVKMYRTDSLQQVTFRDSISPDTDVQQELIHLGWSSVRALNFSHLEPWAWHTFGEHRPDYTPHYTYSKFVLEGRRCRYRRDINACKLWLRRLQKSDAEIAIIAQVALAHGIFSVESGDGLKPLVRNDDWLRFEKFLNGNATSRLYLFIIFFKFLWEIGHPFRAIYRLGVALGQNNDFSTFSPMLRVLNKFPLNISWMPIVALSHGIVSQLNNAQDCEQAANLFNEFRTYVRPGQKIQRHPTRLAKIRSRIIQFFRK